MFKHLDRVSCTDCYQASLFQTKAAYVLFYQKREPETTRSKPPSVALGAPLPIPVLNGITPKMNGDATTAGSSEEDMEVS